MPRCPLSADWLHLHGIWKKISEQGRVRWKGRLGRMRHSERRRKMFLKIDLSAPFISKRADKAFSSTVHIYATFLLFGILIPNILLKIFIYPVSFSKLFCNIPCFSMNIFELFQFQSLCSVHFIHLDIPYFYRRSSGPFWSKAVPYSVYSAEN